MYHYRIKPECVCSCNGFVIFDVSEYRNVNNKAIIYLYDTTSNTFVATETSHFHSFDGASCVKYYAQ